MNFIHKGKSSLFEVRNDEDLKRVKGDQDLVALWLMHAPTNPGEHDMFVHLMRKPTIALNYEDVILWYTIASKTDVGRLIPKGELAGDLDKKIDRIYTRNQYGRVIVPEQEIADAFYKIRKLTRLLITYDLGRLPAEEKGIIMFAFVRLASEYKDYGSEDTLQTFMRQMFSSDPENTEFLSIFIGRSRDYEFLAKQILIVAQTPGTVRWALLMVLRVILHINERTELLDLVPRELEVPDAQFCPSVIDIIIESIPSAVDLLEITSKTALYEFKKMLEGILIPEVVIFFLRDNLVTYRELIETDVTLS